MLVCLCGTSVRSAPRRRGAIGVLSVAAAAIRLELDVAASLMSAVAAAAIRSDF